MDPARSQPVRVLLEVSEVSELSEPELRNTAVGPGAGGDFSVDFFQNSIAGILVISYLRVSPSCCPIHVNLEDP